MKLSSTNAAQSFNYKWLLKRIYPFAKPYLGRIILCILVAIPAGMLDGVVAFSLRPYMDKVIGDKNLVWAVIIPFGIILFAAVQGIFRYLNTYLNDWTSQKITIGVKKALYKKILTLNTKFYDINSSGDIISRFLTDPETASNGLVEQIKSVTTNGVSAISLISVMLFSSWKLAIIGVVVLCVAIIPVILLRKRIKKVSNKTLVFNANIMTIYNETFAGNKIVTAYNLKDRQEKLFNEQIDNCFTLAMSLIKRISLLSPIMYVIASCGIALVMGYGTFLIFDGQMTAGAFAAFVTSLLLLYKPIKTLGHTLTSLQKIFVAMGRVFELFDIEPEISDSPDAKTFDGLENSIKFENVYFQYEESKMVLKNINLEVYKGEHIAIVGNSGGGKTTLVNLLPRFYDLTSGAIKFDGLDIRGLTLDSLHKNIAIVFQDNFLFSGTIRENIMIANPKASEDDLQHVLTYANLDEMIESLPDGVDTVLGERGLALSGGQRQRVAIARAMIKNSPIIILDEATSALDNESEAIVQNALENLMRNKTVFVIAHRLSTIKNATRIAVINDGELVELGTHDQLMQYENGVYKNLYNMQFGSTTDPALI